MRMLVFIEHSEGVGAALPGLPEGVKMFDSSSLPLLLLIFGGAAALAENPEDTPCASDLYCRLHFSDR